MQHLKHQFYLLCSQKNRQSKISPGLKVFKLEITYGLRGRTTLRLKFKTWSFFKKEIQKLKKIHVYQFIVQVENLFC